jgi:hypothetical protein
VRGAEHIETDRGQEGALPTARATHEPSQQAVSALRVGIANAGSADYVIIKNGMYYRPDAAGYTSSLAEAGRYTLEDAVSRSHPNGTDGPRDGISYEYSPKAVSPNAGPRLIERISSEADLCRNDGAIDIAQLLDEAAWALEKAEEALAALYVVRPDNWNDDDDPQQEAAWLLLNVALGRLK